MMTKININKSQIEGLGKQKRVHFITSIGGFKCLALVGTCDSQEHTNLSIFSSFFHIGANPPLIGMIFRPSPPERDTFSNIIETGFFTINHINESIYKQAHQTSARYEKSISEFDVTGLTPESCYNEDGFVSIEKANSITCSGLDSYHKTFQLDRLSYAKPNLDLTSLI